MNKELFIEVEVLFSRIPKSVFGWDFNSFPLMMIPMCLAITQHGMVKNKMWSHRTAFDGWNIISNPVLLEKRLAQKISR
jgi:hypothetical protein